MTAQELRNKLNDEFGIHKLWPKTYEVDVETYGYCCQEIFNWLVGHRLPVVIGRDSNYYHISLGPNKGLMFKNVELIIKKE